jgi:PmbA protein
MSEADLLALADKSVAMAKKAGADHASAGAYEARTVEMQWRDGKLEKVQDATTREIAITLYVDGRYANMSTSDLRPVALEAFVAKAVDAARILAADPHRKLPDPARYANRTTKDLGLYDAKVAELNTDTRKGWLREMEEAARQVPGKERIVSVTTTVTDSTTAHARVTSNGCSVSTRGTDLALEASTSVKDEDDRRPEDWAYGTSRSLAKRSSTAALGREASDRALKKRGAKKVASLTTKVLVDARAASRLVRALLGPMSGGSLQQRQSFLEGKLGKQIGSSLLTLEDQPHIEGGVASRAYDSEGMSTQSRRFVHAGKLEGFFLDVYYASKLGMTATLGRPTNLVVAPGTKDAVGIARSIEKGIYVTDFLGGNSNGTTGDYSLGIQGYLIEKGSPTLPITEMNVSGNQLDLWKRLVHVGADTYPHSSILCPSLLFDGLSVAGK